MTTNITYANHQSTRSTANASSYTLGSYVVGSGSDRVLEVTVSLLRSNENGITVDGVTFGGVALTEGDRSTGISTSRSNYVGVWYLVNPSVSTANIVVTPSATMAGCIISAVTLYGVHQTIPTGDSYRVKDATFGEFDINCGLAQTGGLCVLAVSANANNNPTWTWSGGGSELYDVNNGSGDSNEIAGSAVLRDSDVGGATCTCSISAAMMVGVGVEFLPVGLSIYQQTISISASSDDAGQNSGGSMFLTSTSGNVNNTGDTYFGLRFLGLNLPAGAFPLAAFVRLSVASTTYDTPILTLNTEQNDEPATFAGTANNISSRSLTGKSTTWDEVNIGAGYRRSPNFRRSLDVTVGLGGWAAGDDVVVVLTNAAGPSSAFRFNTYDYSSGSEAPQLIVTWMVTTTVISASAADTLDLTETPSRRAVYRKTAADTFGAVETRQRRGIYRKTIADLLDATGSTTPRRVLRATAFETLDMVSSLGRRADYDGLGIDLLKLLEAAMGGGRLPAVVTDSLEVSEATGPGYVVRRVAADTWQLLPAAGRRASFAAAIGDELGFTDTALYWYVGGLTITATAADGLALLDDTARRALISQATADSLSLAAATTTALSLLLSETWQLSETVALLAGLSVGDVALLGDSVFLTYAATLIEPVKLLEALNRIATLRAGSVDALDYIGAARTKIVTGAGDALELSDGLTARRILAAIAADAARYNLLLTGDMAGVLEAIAADTFDLSAVVAAGWRGRVNAADALEVTETAASMRRFLVAVADAGAIGDVAALMRRARATGQDAAEFGDALRALMRTRAHDAVDISDAALAQVAFILHALAADVVALSDGTVTTWRVTARDRLEFVATVGAVMHWIESVQDVLGLHVAAVYLLPSGIVRIEFAIKGARIQFDIAMPRVDATLKQPRVDLAGHGLIDS